MSDKRELGEGAIDRLMALTVTLHHDAGDALARLDLTTSRAPVVWFLASNGPATQTDIAQAIDVAPRTVTGLVDGLVETGFVTREPHPGDRRAHLVTLTTRAHDAVRELRDQQHQFSHALFADVPMQRVEDFVDTLDHVLQRCRELGLDAPSGS